MTLRIRSCAAAACLSLLTVVLSCAAPVLASQENLASAGFVIDAPRAVQPPPVDGSIDQPVWRTAAHVALRWNVDYRRPASDGTDAYLLADSSYLYIAFVAHQKSPVLVTQHTSGRGVDADDWVEVLLWPGGVNGFRYQFKCNAVGVCYQASTENDDFSPLWKSAGKLTADGFVVTMRIPLAVIRGDGRDQWRLQFARSVSRVGDDTPVWAYAPGMDDEGQAVYSGYLNGMRGLGAAASRQRARLAIYGVGAYASASAGGSTSRTGVDFAVPISHTSSVVGTVHPDYSNVELDQQTISPTVFRRSFQEVRPFFTQGARFYDNFRTINDPGNAMLYTPGIPTPSNGIALEGTNAGLGYAAFDARSPSRTDSAQTLAWNSADKVYSASLQRVTVDAPATIGAPSLSDRVTAGTIRVDNQRNAFAYADFGVDAGSNVLDATRAKWEEFGIAHHGPTSFLGAAVRKIGSYYNPVDGFIAHNDIAGWAASGEQDVLPSAGPILFEGLQMSVDRYRDMFGNLNQADQNLNFSMQTRSQYSLSVSAGSNFLLQPPAGPNDPMLVGAFFDQNGVNLGYRDQSTTPTNVSYNVGRFGNGVLHSWTRLASVQVGPRGSFSLEADDTNLATNDGLGLRQWLERAAYAYQFGGQASFAVGLRRIVGTSPPVFSPPSDPVDSSNVSIALHDRVGADDVYLVYGDANAVSTPAQIILKWVHYFGAEKGT